MIGDAVTNRDMVKDPAPGAAPAPEPNLPPPTPVPASEGDPALDTVVEPLDSYQLKPMLDPHKADGLKRKDRPEGPGEGSGQSDG